MAALDKIAEYGVKKSYGKDDIICVQGEAGSHMYIVLKGGFNVYINSMTDFPLKVGEITPGQFFGEMSVLDDAPRSATVIADRDSFAISLSKEDFRKLVREDGEFAFSVMRTLSGRIRKLNDSIEKTHANYDAPDFPPASPEATEENISILPEGHSVYGTVIPYKYDYFVDSREAKCPVCEQSFIAEIPVFTKLAEKNSHTGLDMRITYENFDVLWFNVWVCPYCNYANYYSAFNRITKDMVEALKTSQYRKMVEKLPRKDRNTIDSVIEGYCLVLHCNRMSVRSLETEAKTWLRLYWLYGDEKKREAAENALKAYEKFAHKMEINHKAQAFTIIAELAASIGNYRKACSYYEQVCTDAKKRNALLYRQALTRLQEFKPKIAE